MNEESKNSDHVTNSKTVKCQNIGLQILTQLTQYNPNLIYPAEYPVFPKQTALTNGELN